MNQRILIIGPAWVGDMVVAQSLFMTLKRQRPGARVDVVAQGWNLPLLARMPEVDEAILAPFGHGELGLGARRTLGRRLRERSYAQAIVLPNSFKSTLVPWHAGVKRRTGWRGEMRYWLINDMRQLDRARLPLLIDRYNALAFNKGEVKAPEDFPAPHPRPSLAVNKAQVEATLEKFGLAADRRPVLALCPGAEYGVSKQWPPRKYAEIAERSAKTRHIWLLGSAKDAGACEAVLEHAGPQARESMVNLAGKTTLGEAIDLLSRAAAVVSNDSGLLHVAAALARPLVAIYGSTSPAFTPPLSETKRIVRLGLPCSPCYERECPLGHNACMKNLPAGLVAEALEEVAGTR